MAAAEFVPAITLTDPNNDPASPSPAFSPTKDAPRGVLPVLDGRGGGRVGDERPGSAEGRGRGGRPESSSSGTRMSPVKLMRAMSPSKGNFTGSSDVVAKKESEPETIPQVMDPLSQHILKRTNAPPPIITTPRTSTVDDSARDDANAGAEQASSAPAAPPLRRVDTNDSMVSQTQTQKDLRKGVKAVSFISRLMGNKKKEEVSTVADDESVSNEGRPEGTDAQVFAQPADNIEFSPRHPHPPSYIKVRSKNKRVRDFDRLFLAQELECRKEKKMERQGSSNKLRRKSSAPSDADTVWAMEFSKDGKYLAAAGGDGIVRVWAVLSSSDDRQKHEKQESTESEAKGVDAHAEHLSAPVFQSKPVREYDGHTSAVLDISWSKNNFLLSSSMDKTVRLWHVSRDECLCTFKHSDFVPSIAFHPKDDRFFLAGSLDSKLRLWSIPDKEIAYTARVHDMVTAVAFTPDGKCAIAGCLSGLCMFYETEGLKYQSQVHVRSGRGHNAKGSKITGIHAHYDQRGDVKLLITSNDSRIRLFNFRDKNLELKFRGNENNSSQIRATVSDDGKYVVCGSEDRKAYVWSTGAGEGEKRDKRPVEMFEAHDTITTVVCFAPTKTRHLLSKSEDPVYDLCNPPPVTLMSRAERAGSQSSSRPATENGSIQATPAEFEQPRESVSYLSRCGHKDGNIIVTADFTGRIKVFRQDCAWLKRRGEDWDRSSLFSKRGNGRLSRTGSVMTRSSQPSLHDGRTSTSLSGPSDRILSWRQGIASSPNVSDGQQHRGSKNGSRSISPRQSMDLKMTPISRDNSPVDARKPSLRKWTGWAANVQSGGAGHRNSSGASAAAVHIDTAKARAAADNDGKAASTRSGSPRSIREDNPLLLSGGRSYMFWDTEEWKGRADRMHSTPADQIPLTPIESRTEGDASHLGVRPALQRGTTNVSELSDERSSASEYDDALEEGGARGSVERKEDEMWCKRCGGLSFTARRLNEGGTCLVCAKCGKRAP